MSPTSRRILPPPSSVPSACCTSRFGKAMRGSPPRRRAVATVMPWAAGALEQYLAEVRPRYGAAGAAALWLTERGERISAPVGR